MDENDRRRRRKGKALLVAGVGIATVSFVGCREPQPPVGNPMMPVPDAGLAPILTDAGDAGAPATPDGGAAGDTDRDAGAVEPQGPPVRFPRPVGNLRPPPRRQQNGTPAPGAPPKGENGNQ